jgi:hypothetical protein
MPTSDRDTKSVLELKRTQRTIQQHINRLYKVCDALYEEIHAIKHHVGYKPPTLDSNFQQRQPQQQQQSQQQMNNPMNSLDNMPDFGDKMPGFGDDMPPQRKLKIIDN